MSDVEKLTVDGATYELRDAYAIPKSNIATNWTSPTTDTVPNTNLVDSRLQVCETNILSVSNGVKLLTKYGGGINKLRYNNSTETVGEATFTINDDKSISIYTNGATTTARALVLVRATDNINVDATDIVSGLNSYSGNGIYFGWGIGSSGGDRVLYPNEVQEAIGTSGVMRYFAVYVGSGVNIPQQNAFTVNPMIVSAQDYANLSGYQPYALPNYDLTRLEAEDRAALAEQVDEGAKNKFDFANITYNSSTNCTYTKTDDSITVTSQNVADGSRVTYTFDLEAGSYVFRAKITNLTIASVTTLIRVLDGSGNILGGSPVSKNGIVYFPFRATTTGTYKIMYAPNWSSATFVNTFTASENMICTEADWKISQNFAPYALPNTDLTRMMTPFFTVPINHNMIYRGQNLGDTFTDAQHTALSSGNFTDLYLGDYWTKTVTIPAFYEVTTAEPSDWSTNYTSYYTKSGDTYTPVSGDTAPTWAADTYYQKSVPTQTVTLKAVIADFDTFYAGYASGYAAINTHHAAVIVTGFNNVVWNKTNTTAGGYVNSLIHKWLVGSVLPQIETWFGSAKVLSHQKMLTNAITGDAASGWAWSSQKISLLSECQLYGMKVWGGSKATNGAYEPGEAFKHLNVFNHIDANLLFGNKNIWLRDIASLGGVAYLDNGGVARDSGASIAWLAPAALILLS